MPTYSVNGVELAYRDLGQGPLLFLLHAFPLDGSMWEPQIAALAAKRRLIIPDLRGFGQSATVKPMLSLEQVADDIAALVRVLGDNRVSVCGLSMGGYVAFELLRRHPIILNGLILADTRPGADTEAARQRRETNAQLAEQHGVSALAEQLLPGLLSDQASEALRAQVRAIIERQRSSAVAAALRAMAVRLDNTAQLARIRVPTTIIVGQADTITPVAEAEAMHAAIAGSRLVQIPGAGHLANLEQPEAFNAAVLQIGSP